MWIVDPPVEDSLHDALSAGNDLRRHTGADGAT